MLSKRWIHNTRPVWQRTLTPLTHIKHPELKRHSAFSKITPKDLNYFKSILSAQNVVYDDNPESISMTPYNTDWFNLFRGASSLCLFPKSTEQVSKILKYCNQHQLAVVTQGGNTGVSGGAVPVFDEIIVNTSKLNSIRKFDPVSGVAVVDAGVVLEQLDQYLETKGYTVPLDLGAKGSCQLGGNVSTNAGGLRLMRFGSLHGNVLGLEVVLPDGTILDNLSTLRKDNTGYDLKQLFIGAEGTLGLVTGVSLLTPRRAKSTNLVLVALNSFEAIQKAYVMAKEDLSEILSAFEFWDDESVHVVKTQMMQKVDYPIEGKYPFYALIETQGSKQGHDQEKLDGYLARLLEEGIAHDGVMAQDTKQISSLWSWREKIPESMSKAGTAMTYDVSMEVPLLYKMVEDAKEHFGNKGELGTDKLYSNLLGFGHVGDGNLHIMANLNKSGKEGQEAMDKFVYSWAMKHHGSITAEHGVGVAKVHYMNKAKSAIQLQLMRTIKKAIDPNGIMNPYKVVPE
ncbi:D-lactate dehydrogenase [cytochrome] 2, mitochondrial [Choanephora cucurbitarum]|uniref:D-lactate dehydrogenase [cytochrome] 2, mitochondrial n=1 Tax=Choanephora cucurbitarum TaxID=101091 RepID=A0A1C7MW51_9FUNG|nr:D-lactate dehydrogenase [cytochrome] 2, mitochondrial [Choanephora cucurbitarum]